jgi:hypothetical protein
MTTRRRWSLEVPQMPEENLTTIDEAIRAVQRHTAGDRTSDRVPTSESVGDPDAGSREASAESGAAAGAILGTAIAGPLGLAAGAGIGAAAGGVAEGEEEVPRTRDAERKAEQYEEWRENDDDATERGIRGGRPRPST